MTYAVYLNQLPSGTGKTEASPQSGIHVTRNQLKGQLLTGCLIVFNGSATSTTRPHILLQRLPLVHTSSYNVHHSSTHPLTTSTTRPHILLQRLPLVHTSSYNVHHSSTHPLTTSTTRPHILLQLPPLVHTSSYNVHHSSTHPLTTSTTRPHILL